MLGFPSIPQVGEHPRHLHCQRSVWTRRSRSGRPLWTSRCQSRCRDLHRETTGRSVHERPERMKLTEERNTIQMFFIFVEQRHLVLQSDVSLAVT